MIDVLTREELDLRLRTILPAEYQDTYADLQPEPMRSAGLKYDGDGRVAWDEIWGSFCDLAMAGGPPHKGALLEPATREDIDAEPLRYAEVVAEICRGLSMVTGLSAGRSRSAGWIRVTCEDATAAAWLHRAIVMENVSVRSNGKAIELPASPMFRVEKEIKNVITVLAKTYHYWDGHMPFPQQWAIRRLFDVLSVECPLVEPEHSKDGRRSAFQGMCAEQAAHEIRNDTGLIASKHEYANWLGLQCASVRDAVWMMRALVACNVLSRREDTVLFVPLNTLADPGSMRMRQALSRVYRLRRD